MSRLIFLIGLTLILDSYVLGLSEDNIAKFHEHHGFRYKRSSINFANMREGAFKKLVAYSNCISEKALKLAEDTVARFRVKPEKVADYFAGSSLQNMVCSNFDSIDCSLDTTRTTPTCDAAKKYSNIDGTCNNIKNPKWGSSNTPFRRMLNPLYADGICKMRTKSLKMKDGSYPDLPSARQISVRMSALGPLTTNTEEFSIFLMQWGQFMDHDLVKTPEHHTLNSDGTYSKDECCEDGVTTTETKNCLPLDVKNDNFFDGTHSFVCRPFVRSMRVVEDFCKVGPCTQVNELTHYIDASSIYGSTMDELTALRGNMHGGLLLTNQKSETGNSGCDSQDYRPLCHLPEYTINSNSEFQSGDARVMETAALTSTHTLFMRLHNYLANEIKQNSPSLTDDQVFEEARRIVVALVQKITYDEFLPIVLGTKGMDKCDIKLKGSGHTKNYDEDADPTTPSVFATAAFRFGHSLVRTNFRTNVSPSGSYITLLESFFNRDVTLTSGQYPSDILEGLTEEPSEIQDHFLNNILTNQLFAASAADAGSDLAALNIKRGRDHGIPGFLAWREKCGLSFDSKKKNKKGGKKDTVDFNTLKKIMNKKVVEEFEKLYNVAEDIDLFPAGLAEEPDPKHGGILGPTFSCILCEHFKNLKNGDRFWFENEDHPNKFSEAQLEAIRKTKLSAVICKMTDMNSSSQLRKYVMKLTGNKESCQDLTSGTIFEKMNLFP